MRKLKPKLLFPAILIGTVFLSMCLTSDKTDITAVVKLLPDVQQFLNEHPDAEIKAALWSASAVETNIGRIREDCGPQIENKSYWRAEVKENDLDLIIWLDSDSKQPVCVVKKRTATTPTQTTTSTPAFTPLVTQTVAPTLTPTPTQTASPTATSAPTNMAIGFASLQVKDWNVASSNGMLTLVLENKYGSQITLTGINATRTGTTNGCEVSGLTTVMAENQELILTTTGTIGYGGNCATGLASEESYTLDVKIFFTSNSVSHIDTGTISTVDIGTAQLAVDSLCTNWRSSNWATPPADLERVSLNYAAKIGILDQSEWEAHKTITVCDCAVYLYADKNAIQRSEVFTAAPDSSTCHANMQTKYPLDLALPGAEIAKSMVAGATGDQIRFILQWKNSGKADTPDVQVRDFIPTGFKLVNSTGQPKLSDALGGQYIDWTLGKIKVGDVGTLNYTIEGHGTYSTGEALLIVR